ncbi:MAG: hypothetical protein HOO90_02820 [Methylotenera sp.]|uniref:hypothetical protein n=1 Tax=Methylotenera sp. TaxID=2051956 RepID=UPI0018199E01|nr:hypothetical protein [Methylotenera sp.]NOU24450.1 hypothetical protein [Methylotenera sp.]
MKAGLTFSLSLICSCMMHAQAAESACTEQDAANCSPQSAIAQTPTPSLRDLLDKGKDKLANKLYGLQLSAFGDAHSNYSDSGKQMFEWGVFEVDAAIDSGAELQGAMAIVTDKNKTTIPVAFLDYHTFGGLIAPRGRLWAEKGFHLQAGRFDVPFGNDWQFYASKDSVSISRPLTTELVMEGGYNDIGIRALGNNGTFNFNTFLLRGFNRGQLLGGRLGVTPFSDPFSLKNAKDPKTFEIGLSYLYDADKAWNKNESAFAIDSEAHLSAWTARFEYIVRSKNPLLSDGATRQTGWHFTQEFALPESVAWPTTVFVRYEKAALRPSEISDPEIGTNAGDGHDARIAAGFSTNLGNADLLLWKFEIQHYLRATPSTREMPGYRHENLLFTQLVLTL